MFRTETEMRHAFKALPDIYSEATYPIVERRTGRRAAVTLAGRPREMLEQLAVVYQDGWGIIAGPGLLDFTRRDTMARSAIGMNRTRYGY